MAQHRKATADEIARDELREAVRHAEARLARAREDYADTRSIDALRERQVAQDELKALSAELRKYDYDRDPEAVRRQDAAPRRQRTQWPVGKPDAPPKAPRTKVIARQVVVDRTNPATQPQRPAAVRPPALQSRTVENADGKTERVSWWVGLDRAGVQQGATVLATAPPPKTSKASTKAQIKHAQQVVNDDKRDARKAAEPAKEAARAVKRAAVAARAAADADRVAQARADRIARKLLQKINPTAGAFTSIPRADSV